MIFIGIDPGVSGAIAVLTTNTSPLISTWEVDDIPTVKVGKRREVDATKLYGMLSKLRRRSVPWFGGIAVALERVHSMPGQGVSSTFSFGKATGTIIGCLAGAGLWGPCPGNPGNVTKLVTPQVWKKAMLEDMPKEKESSVVRCRELFPYTCDHLTLKSHHNRADAMLIAEHLRLTTGEVSE